jgi:hypothetical protein
MRANYLLWSCRHFFFNALSMEAVLLAKTAIHLQTGASLHGRALAQTAVTLDKNMVVSSGN